MIPNKSAPNNYISRWHRSPIKPLICQTLGAGEGNRTLTVSLGKSGRSTGLSRTGPGQAGYVRLRLTAHPGPCGLVLLETGGFDAVPQQIPSKRSWRGTASPGAADPVEVEMNSKDVAPVTQQRPGSAEPGVPDLGRIGEQIGSLWGDYGYALVAGVGVLVIVVVVTAVVKVARSRQRDRAVGGLTALVVLAWTSEGLWEVARFTLGLPLGFAVMTFFVYEAMMLTCALQAERHRKHHPSPGPAGRYVWVLAAITATVVALNAQTLVEALLRFTLPLAAAGLWWVGITAERDDDPDEVKQLRDAERKRREAIWAISWRRLLVAVGVMRPGAQTLTEAERERRIRQMVTAADKLQWAAPGSRRAERALQRLRRLARLASANDIAAVRARVARTTRIAELVMPPTNPAATGDHLGHARK
jgi:hypothetical protein